MLGRLSTCGPNSIRSRRAQLALLFLTPIALTPIALAQTPADCAACHFRIAETFARTGMARTFGPVDAVPPIPGGVLRHQLSAQFFSISVRGGIPWLKRYQSGGANVFEKPIAYWIGSGNHARSYLGPGASGELVELPLTLYSGGAWAMSPAYDRADHLGFSRRITYRCMFCHNAYPDVPQGSDDSDSATQFPATLPQGIDCQRCHGPGRAHIEAAQSGQPVDAVRRAIVNPAHLAPARQLEVCLQCHLETTTLKLPASLKRYDRGVFSYRPGEPLDDYILNFDSATPGDRFEFNSSAYRLRLSACFRGSNGALTCTTCHNPHESAAVSPRACRQCHSTLSAGHPAGPDCVSCHMPKRRPSDAVRVTVTDHFIRRRIQAAPAVLTELNDANTKPYRGEVVLYYPSATRESGLYLAIAQVRDQANLTAGLERLEAAIAREKPRRGEFYLELAEAFRHAGKPEKAASFYTEACVRSEKDWRPFYGLGLVLSALGNLDGATGSFRRAISLAPRETAPPLDLARLMLARNRPLEAIAALEQAIQLVPESADLYTGLAAAQRRAGNSTAAGKSKREATRLRP
jgi:hypothetical protein